MMMGYVNYKQKALTQIIRIQNFQFIYTEMTMNERSSTAPKGSSFHGENTPFPEIDDSDEERELTNLNWLLRNQNLTWPKTIIDSSTDEHLRACYDGQSSNIRRNHTKQIFLTKCITKSQKDLDCKTTQKAISKRPSPTERYEIFLNKVKR